jgi:hypothetical protein
VLILDRQNSLATLNMRGKAIGDLRSRENVTVVGLHSKPSSWDIDPEQLRTICQVYQPVIFVDSLIDHVPDGKSESDSVTMHGVFRQFDSWIESGASAVVVLHHKTKTGENYRGTTAIPAAVSTAINVSNRKGSGPWRILTLKHFKARDGEEQEVTLKVSFENKEGQLLKVNWGSSEATASKSVAKPEDDVDRKVEAYVRENPGQSKNTILKGTGGKRITVLRSIDRLAKNVKIYAKDEKWFPVDGATTTQ